MSGPFRVLLVEDEADLREDIAEMLEFEGCVVRAAADGAAGLRLLEEGWRPDVILSDRLMPALDGDGLLRAVRADPRFADTPFVFMTALTGDAQEISSLREGADGYIAKPAMGAVVAERLRAAARNARRARAEAAAEIARRRSAFLAIIPHELRTPLTPILGYSEMLRGDPSLPGAARRMADSIAAGAHELLQRINDLLDLGAAAHFGLAFCAEPTSLKDCVDDALALHARAAAEKALTVTRAAEDRLIVVDPRLTRRALGALLSNAVKFAPHGGRIVIGVEDAPEGAMAVTIADDGPGFSAAARASAGRVFEPGDSSHTRTAGGQGVGLPLVRAICDAHGAAFEIHDRPGGGALVKILFPPPANEG